MSVLQLPPSLNLSQAKPGLAPGVDQLMTTYPSTNSTYGSGDTCIIEIGTGGRNTFLYGNESYLSFEFTPTFSGATTGSVQLDGSAFALIDRFSLYHGAEQLCQVNSAGKLWQCLSDLASLSTRSSASIDMGAAISHPADGVTLVSGTKYLFCIPLVAPLVGSLSDKATPLGWCQASGALRMEIQWSTFATAVTTSKFVNDIEDCGGTCTVAPTLTSYVIGNVAYHAKLSRVSNDINMALLQSFQGQPVSLPATDYRSEVVYMAGSALAISARLNFNFSSLKAILWWTQAQGISQGTITTFNTGRPSSSRYAGGALSQYYLQIDGQDSLHIRCGANGATLPMTSDKPQNFHCAIPYNEVKRVFNGITSGTQQSVFDKSQYAPSTAVDTEQRVIAGKFVAGLDCERSDSSDVAFSGMATKNSNVLLNIEYESRASASAHNLYVYGMADVVYSIVNGSIVRSD